MIGIFLFLYFLQIMAAALELKDGRFETKKQFIRCLNPFFVFIYFYEQYRDLSDD